MDRAPSATAALRLPPPMSCSPDIDADLSAVVVDSSTSSSSSCSTSTSADHVANKVYVAVPEDYKAGMSTLVWTIQNLHRKGTTLVLAHVRAPPAPKLIGRMREQEVRAYHLERHRLDARMDHYLKACAKLCVPAHKLVIEMDDVAQGLLLLISLHAVTALVMGAAADRHYSKKMKTPKSRKAATVMDKADPSCKIWFVCKGALVCTRAATAIVIPAIPPSPAPSSGTGSLSSVSDAIPSFALHNDRTPPRTTSSTPELPWEPIPVPSHKTQASDHIPWMLQDDLDSMTASKAGTGSDDDSQFQEDEGIHSGMYEKYKEAIIEAEAARKEAYEESNKRRRAERDLLLALQKAREADNMYQNETKRRQGVEEALIQQRQENERMRSQMDNIFNKLQEAEERKLKNEQRITEFERATKDLEDKLAATRYLMQSHKSKNEQLQQERDEALHEMEELKKKAQKQTASAACEELSMEFSYAELELATRKFSDQMKIGEGSSGCVYRGLLRNTPVAVKLLHQDGIQVTSKFHQEIAVLTKVRHPNLVTLLGSCPEACGLVYEYLPNGSLEDRLLCSNNTPPLTWQQRIRIIGEICVALLFLHASKPRPMVHGNLKPDNVLLDANLVSKLSDFGICQMPIHSNTGTSSMYHTADPKSNLAYTDPEFVRTGEVTPKSDVYSFGIIILRLLTGWQPFNISNRVEEAIENGSLHSVIDPTAGEWPFVQASRLAHLGLSCTELSRRMRADLMKDVWQVIKPMIREPALPDRPLSFISTLDDRQIPSYFICPILQEVMNDPHVAADGFTYEAEAIQEWFDSGQDVSPMTNQKLAHHELIPNRALRSAILEWTNELRRLSQIDTDAASRKQ